MLGFVWAASPSGAFSAPHAERCSRSYRISPYAILTVSPHLTPLASRNLLVYQSLPTRLPDREAKVRRRKDDIGVSTATSSITEGLSRVPRRVQPHGGPAGRVRRALSTGSGGRGRPAPCAALSGGSPVPPQPQEC